MAEPHDTKRILHDKQYNLLGDMVDWMSRSLSEKDPKKIALLKKELQNKTVQLNDVKKQLEELEKTTNV